MTCPIEIRSLIGTQVRSVGECRRGFRRHCELGLTLLYDLLKFGHILGAVLIGAGLIGVFVSDLRSRQLRDLAPFGEAVRNIAVFYDGVVVPGALLLLASGAWLAAEFHGGWAALREPWIAGMAGLFAFEFVEGNTVTRAYFTRLRRVTRTALAEGRITPELERARAERIPTFTHFLDLPILLVIIALGAIRPDGWLPLIAGLALAVLVATALTLVLLRLYPWGAVARREGGVL